jgi:hypothetical protein
MLFSNSRRKPSLLPTPVLLLNSNNNNNSFHSTANFLLVEPLQNTLEFISQFLQSCFDFVEFFFYPIIGDVFPVELLHININK